MLVHELHASWIKVHFSDLGALFLGILVHLCPMPGST